MSTTRHLGASPAEPPNSGLISDEVSSSGWPERLGAYRVQRLLGRGGMGEVYLAWDQRLERHVAIKRLRPERVTDAQRERFRREARAAAQLQHPSVVQVFDILELDEGDGIVMEYVPGRTVAELVRHGPLAMPLAMRLAQQVAEGLAAAHARGLVHRDLKAENVILTESLDAKILDFGLVTTRTPTVAETTLTEPGAVLGTASAMAPEQARGEATDARTDLFALGVLLYRMLCGAAPYAGVDSADTLRRLRDETAIPLSQRRGEVPATLARLVDRLLSKDPTRRPQNAQEVAQSLAAMSGGAVVPEADTGGSTSTLLLPPARRRQLKQRRRRWLRWAGAAAAAVVAAAVVIGGLFVWMRPSEPPPLRVLVLEPEITVRDEAERQRLEAVASAVLTASLSGLGELEGVQALDPALAVEAQTLLLQARAAAADEVLYAEVAGDPFGDGGRVSLRRLDGETGAVRWADSFAVPADRLELRLTADSVAAYLQRAWPEQRPRAGVPVLEVRPEDYATFLDLRRQFVAERLVEPAQLDTIETILEGSPRFFSGYLLGVAMHLQRFTSSRRSEHLQQASDLLDRAAELAPEDPELLSLRFAVQRLGGKLEEAAATVDRLTRLTPANVNLLSMRADLARQQGDTEAARTFLRKAVERAPAWELRYRLADLASKTGDLATAREQLQRILEQQPNHPRALARLADVELLYGDVGAAEEFYQRLVAEAPRRSLLTNLGLAQYLLGRYQDAVDSYQQALQLDPEHPIVLLNLADAETALGHTDEAREIYQRLLRRLEAPGTDLPLNYRMVRAQCLAHLGQVQAALEVVQRTWQQDQDNPDMAYQAAVVYAVAGERASALLAARQAVERGLQPRWLRVPVFDTLAAQPGFQELLVSQAR